MGVCLFFGRARGLASAVEGSMNCRSQVVTQRILNETGGFISLLVKYRYF